MPNPEAVEKLIVLDWPMAIFVVVGAGFLAFLGAYLAEWGKYRALRDNVRAVTAAQEEIKHQLAGGLWLDQKRWDLRREAYLPILEFHRAVLDRLNEAVRHDDPKKRFREIVIEEERRLQLPRARAAIAVAVPSSVRDERIKALDDALDAFRTDDLVLSRPQNKTFVQLQAIARSIYDGAWERLAATAAQHLAALTAAECAALEAKFKEDALDSQIMRKALAKESLTPDEQARLRRLFPPKDGEE